MPNNSSAGSEILSRLQQAPTIHPASASLFTDWSLEPGDVVTVKSDEESYMVPIYTMLMEWTGSPKVDISSSGNQKREPLPALTRRDYATRSAINGMRQKMEDQEEINQQYQHWRTETNQQLTSVYKITGVKFDRYGRPIYQQAKDAQGNPLWETDAQGNPVYDTDLQGNIIYETDEQGNYVLDEHGNKIPRKKPVYVLDEAGNPVPVYDPDSTGSISGQVTQTAQHISAAFEYDPISEETPVFDPKEPYQAGDYVLYPDEDGTPCRFTKDHTGPWTGTDIVWVPKLSAQVYANAEGLKHTVTATMLGETLQGYLKQTAFTSKFGNKIIDNDGNIVKAEFATQVVDGIGVAAISADKIKLNANAIIAAVNDGKEADGETPTSLKIQADRITLDGTTVIKAINGAPASETSGEGQEAVTTKIGINASHILLTGDTLLSGQVTVNNGMFYVLTSLGVGNIGTDIVSINNGKVTAMTHEVKIGGKVNFVVDQSHHYELTAANVPNIFIGASVANNTLTLTKINGTTINFKKATTLNTSGTYTVDGTSVTAGWSGGTYTVVATQTNYNTTTEEDETTVVGTASTTIGISSSSWNSPASETVTADTNHPHGVKYTIAPSINLGYQVTQETGPGSTETIMVDIPDRTGLTISAADITSVYEAGRSAGLSALTWDITSWDYDDTNDVYQCSVRTWDGSTVIDTEYVSLPSLKTVVTNPTTKQSTWWKTSGTNANKYVIPGTSISAQAYLSSDTNNEHGLLNVTGQGSDIVIDPTEAVTAGQNSVNVTGPTWAKSGTGIDSSNTATFTTDADDPNANAEKALALTLSTTLTVNNYSSGSIPIGCTATVSDGTSTVLNKTDSKALGISFEVADAGTATPTQLVSNTTYALKVTKDGTTTNVAYYSTPAGGGTALNPNVIEYGTWSDGKMIFAPDAGTGTAYHLILTHQVSRYRENSHVAIVRTYEYLGEDNYSDTGIITTLKLTQIDNIVYLTKGNDNPSIFTAVAAVEVNGSSVEPRSAYSLSDIQLLSSDAGNVVQKNVTVTYDDGDTDDLSISVDATAITDGGGTSSMVDSIVKNGNVSYSANYKTVTIPVAAKDGNTTLYSTTVSADITDAWQDGYTTGLGESTGDGGISGATLTQTSDSATDHAGWTNKNKDITLSTKYGLIAVEANNGTYYRIRIDASDVYEAGQNSASGDTGGVSGITYDNTSSSTNTNNSTVYANWAKNTSIALPQQYQYALLTVNAKDGSQYKVGINASAVYTAGANSVSLGTKTITSNGTYYASNDGYNGYKSVTVNVGSDYAVSENEISMDTPGTSSSQYSNVARNFTISKNYNYVLIKINVRGTTRRYQLTLA